MAAEASSQESVEGGSLDTVSVLDVAIIGAGPGGLSAALALSNKGFKVAVFERANAFRPIGAALGLNDPAYEALSALSPALANNIKCAGATPKWHTLQRPTGEILYEDESMFAGSGFTWLGWFTLQSALKEHCLLNKVPIYLQHSLVDFCEEPAQSDESGEHSLVKLLFKRRDGGSIYIHTSALIGADGYNSVVRSKAVNDGQPLYTGTMTWRGVIERQSLDTAEKPFCNTEDNCNLSVIGGGKNFWVMDCGAGQLAWTGTALHDETKSGSALETALKVFKDWPPIVEQLMLMTDASAIVESGVYDREPVKSWHGLYKRVTLLGDAAHPMRPSLGLGSTNAFQDALVLSEKLSAANLKDDSSVASALCAYEADRIEFTTPLVFKARDAGRDSHSAEQADRMKMMLESIRDKKKAANQERFSDSVRGA